MLYSGKTYSPALDSADIASFHEMIMEAKVITTLSHVRPDGDAVGSSLGIYGFLESLGKDVISIFPTAIPDSLQFIPKKESILIFNYAEARATERILSSDLIICLDFNTPSRIEEAGEVLRSSKAKKVLIDHHLNPERDFFDLSFSITEISSASELAYHILTLMPEVEGECSALPLPCRRALMTGMTTDTNNFANSVFPSTLMMAADLIASGVDRDEIIRYFMMSYRENRIRLMGNVLKDFLKITPEGIAYYIIPHAVCKAYDIKEGDTEGIVNIPLTIGKVRMCISLKEEPSCFRVSIRSKKGTSANYMARAHFSGGGHENAAGGKLFIGTAPNEGDACIADSSMAEQYILDAIKDCFGNGY